MAGCWGEPADSASESATGSRSTAPQIDPEHPVVRIDTNLGAIVVELDAVNAPGTVRNFLNYATEEFYTDTLFHYTVPHKMILGGGYTPEHQLKPVRTPIRNEAHNGLKNVRGTIAMARDATLLDSATSQFFINLADAPQLDHTGETAEDYGYCVFGKVIEGIDVADRISESPTTTLSGDLVQLPDPPVVIRSIRVIR